MILTELSKIFGEEWLEVKIFYVKGVPHYVGCHVIKILGLSSTTYAIRGPKYKPKLALSLYRKHSVPSVNPRCKVYLLTADGILQVLNKNRRCGKYRRRLRVNAFTLYKQLQTVAKHYQNL